MKLTCFSAAFVMAGTAALPCPTAADLPNGIKVTETDGVTHIFQQTEPGVVEVMSDYGGGEIGRNLFAKGVYVVRLSVEVDGVLDIASLFQVTYPVPVDAIPTPKPNQTQGFDTTVTSRFESFSERQDHVWGARGSLTIGACTYEAIEGTLDYNDGSDPFTETILYLPQLGIGLLSAYTYPGEAPDLYTFAAIEAL